MGSSKKIDTKTNKARRLQCLSVRATLGKPTKQMHRPESLDMADDQLQQGRQAPFTMLAEWMLLADVGVGEKALYWALKAHLFNSGGGSTVYPSQTRLAKILKTSQPTINRWVKGLVALGAIDKHDPTEPGGGCTYTLHDTPPDEYPGLASFAHWKRQAQAERPATTAARDKAPDKTDVKRTREPRPPLPPSDAPLKSDAQPATVTAAERLAAKADAVYAARALEVVDDLGVPLTERRRNLIGAAIAAKLAEGWTSSALRRELEGFHVRARMPERVAIMRLSELGAPPAAPPPGPARPARGAKCTRRPGHKGEPADGCTLCASEAAWSARTGRTD